MMVTLTLYRDDLEQPELQVVMTNWQWKHIERNILLLRQSPTAPPARRLNWLAAVIWETLEMSSATPLSRSKKYGLYSVLE
jgi:hypothetical protein